MSSETDRMSEFDRLKAQKDTIVAKEQAELESIRAGNAELEAQLAAMREAAKPFTVLGNVLTGMDEEYVTCSTECTVIRLGPTVGECRKLRDALATPDAKGWELERKVIEAAEKWLNNPDCNCIGCPLVEPVANLLAHKEGKE